MVFCYILVYVVMNFRGKKPFIVDFNTVWCPATWWTPGSRTFTHPPSSTPSGINYNTICILWTSYFFIQSVTQSGVKPFLCWPITQQNSHVQTLMSISAKGGGVFPSLSLFSLFFTDYVSHYIDLLAGRISEGPVTHMSMSVKGTSRTPYSDATQVQW